MPARMPTMSRLSHVAKSWTEQSTVFYFVFFFVSTNFVNKYVLSVLKFTYPTIFQGWQVMVGGLIMWALAASGHITLKTSEYHTWVLIPWSPAMVLCTVSIYTGSVSLASLAVPIFFSVRCLITAAGFIIDYALHKKAASQLGLIPFLLVCVMATVYTDPQFNPRPYLWIAVHITAVVLYEVYCKTLGTKLNLGAIDRVFCNYVCGVILLAPSSMLLGDVMAAKHYEFFYFYKFYMGCFASGVFGTMLVLQGIKLSESDAGLPSREFIVSLSRILASVLSLLLFDFTVTATNLLCICFTLATELLMIENFGRHSKAAPGDLPRDRPPTIATSYSTDSKEKLNGFHATPNNVDDAITI